MCGLQTSFTRFFLTKEKMKDSGFTKSGSSPQPEALLDEKQVAELFKVHPKTIQKLARSGEIPAMKLGRYWRFRASSLSNWIDVKFAGQSLTERQQ
jgi:excisionase family DNA binding protein